MDGTYSMLAHRYIALLFAIAIFPLIIACGRQPYEIVPVSGQVCVNGKPTAGIQINFQPRAKDTENPNPGPGSYAVTDNQGRYELKVIGENKSGAVLANHIVRMVPYNAVSAAVEIPVASNINLPRYAMDGSIEYDVPEGGTDQANFDLRLR